MYIVIGLLFFIALIFFMWREAHYNEVKEDVLVFKNYPGQKPLTFFFISDLHRRTIHPSIIQNVTSKAEFIIIGGDLGEKGVPLKRVDHNLRLLKEVAPVFFVWGNNDYELPSDELHELFKSHDICVLRNGSFCLPADSDLSSVCLLGVDDFSKGNSDKARAFAEVPADSFKILISHNPFFTKKLTPADGVSLFLSGHTHGGQIRFFDIGPYKKGGWEQQDGMSVLVSNGYGTSALPLRLGARAETHLITIKKGQP
ncbi:metallophosphoesterase [Bacillus aerolatus]|uniref:Metallophosphoesterase n=1 Tax=Bacillus aerolatus TaxID=2653354 RepID=A0A6I1FKH6_9BACI|nr:metallophosphoesterase [Bacillus aerolatus]